MLPYEQTSEEGLQLLVKRATEHTVHESQLIHGPCSAAMNLGNSCQSMDHCNIILTEFMLTLALALQMHRQQPAHPSHKKQRRQAAAESRSGPGCTLMAMSTGPTGGH